MASAQENDCLVYSAFQSLQHDVNCLYINVFFLKWSHPSIFEHLYRVASSLSNKVDQYVTENKDTLKSHPAAHKQMYRQFRWLYQDYSEQMRRLLIKYQLC